MSQRFTLAPLEETDVPYLPQLFIDSFHAPSHPQSDFFKIVFPDTPDMRAWLGDSFRQMLRTEQDSVFLKVVDEETLVDAYAVNGSTAESKVKKLAGYAKWVAPGRMKTDWVAFGESMPKDLCDLLFGGMERNRAALMGGRRHWFLESLGVSNEYQRKGIGAMLVRRGCELADRDGVEAYVDASEAGAKLYEKFGFVAKNSMTMPAPYVYTEAYLVRPAAMPDDGSGTTG